MTMSRLDGDDQSKLDYADCYLVSKTRGNRLDFLILARWSDDFEEVIVILNGGRQL